MKAFITGISGQDGSYLAEFLLSKGYEIYGLVRRLSKPNTSNIGHILDKVTLVEGDLLDQSSLNTAIRKIQPDEIYNLAAQSFVGTSWIQPVLTGEITGMGALRVFEAVRNECPLAKVYQAGSSEMFGAVKESPQSESTQFYPRSPYGVSKIFAHMTAVNYRESYNMFISNGILFNHESPRRGEEFVTKKIARNVARIAKTEHKDPIRLGNTEAKRDWGYAPEYVEAMWLMLQQKEPDDFVIATGEMHTVKEFIVEAFKVAGFSVYPDDELTWKSFVTENLPENTRPAEVSKLCGDYSRAKRILGWEPRIKFKELVRIMVEYELGKYEKKN